MSSDIVVGPCTVNAGRVKNAALDGIYIYIGKTARQSREPSQPKGQWCGERAAVDHPYPARSREPKGTGRPKSCVPSLENRKLWPESPPRVWVHTHKGQPYRFAVYVATRMSARKRAPIRKIRPDHDDRHSYSSPPSSSANEWYLRTTWPQREREGGREGGRERQSVREMDQPRGFFPNLAIVCLN